MPRPSRFRRVAKSFWLGVLVGPAFGAVVLWFAQLAGPIHICKGPKFRDVRWVITTDIPDGPGWGMWDATETKDVYSTAPGSKYPYGAVEVPKDEAPPLDALFVDDCSLFGAGYGYLHLGFASFRPVPQPKTPPAPGMVYVCSAHYAVSLPFWLLIPACLTPVIAVIRGPLRRYRRRKRGWCVRCGYDLTGNESGVCPECSTPVPKRETTA